MVVFSQFKFIYLFIYFLFIHIFSLQLDWLQSPVTKYLFLIILFDNPLK